MPLPQMGNVLTSFQQNVTLRQITQTIVDHRTVETSEDLLIPAVVQVAQKEKLAVANVDFSLQYLTVHSRYDFDINDFICYRNKNFKIIDLGDWSDYGYYESVAEEVK